MTIADFYRGDTRKIKVTVKDSETQQPISVDGGKLTVTFKKTATALDADADLQVVVNTTEADPLNPTGEILVTLSHTDTEIEPGTYFYDFQFVSATGEVTTILAGKVKVLTDITRTV
jgi:hypothetical protein